MNTVNHWQARVEALLHAARDVREDFEPRKPAKMPLPGTLHEALFQRYVAALHSARSSAQSWWNGVVTNLSDPSGQYPQAQALLLGRYPAKALGHGDVIGVLREYWLACAALNQQVATREQIAPEEFVLGLLLDLPHHGLAQFLSELAYWPIGVDTDGNWV